ncbi:hypothetical protein [Streptomyces sp. AK02-01A]|uniref:hypothetical protein n=1 Tax=Streptomyces sp. AK02-01A TaxID=3028648 RepID=UPI0029BEF8AC|nr:hypothetical protein [Streptomyces sp. AK02-01A]MDX3850970.1 hypothetical protein [Streptomyces sp. AK02-01A]
MKRARRVLAGAAVLGALLLVALVVPEENTPSGSVKAGSEDLAGDSTREVRPPDTGRSVIARTEESGTPKDNAKAADKTRDRGEASGVSPSHEARLVAPDTSPRASGTPQRSHWTTTVVRGASELKPGQSWATNRITLAFQGDGNLVLYDTKGTPLWWAGTEGRGAKTAFQGDGNFVVYTKDGEVAWASKTMGHDGAQLVMEAGGDVVIRSGGTVLWSTDTAI